VRKRAVGTIEEYDPDPPFDSGIDGQRPARNDRRRETSGSAKADRLALLSSVGFDHFWIVAEGALSP
jgi:hypothetical protein